MAGLLPLLHFGISGMPLNLFDDMKTGFASLLGSTPDVGGYLIGIIVVFFILLAAAMILGKDGGVLVIIIAASGVMFVTLVGFWPWWTIIFAALLLAVIIFRPFSMGAGGS